MLIKETICTEIDERGRVIKRTREVRTYDEVVNRGYDYGTRNEYDELHRSSLGRVCDAYQDYCRTKEW